MKATIYRTLLLLNFIITGVLCYIIVVQNKLNVDFSNDIIKVRGIAVVDSTGIERVIIGSPLPNPPLHGYRGYRGEYGSISGILLYDSEGQERGGYVTDNSYGNVFLTLDSKTQQNALFIADPHGGAGTILWGKNGNKISLLAGDEDIYLDLTKNNKKLKFKLDEE